MWFLTCDSPGWLGSPTAGGRPSNQEIFRGLSTRPTSFWTASSCQTQYPVLVPWLQSAVKWLSLHPQKEPEPALSSSRQNQTTFTVMGSSFDLPPWVSGGYEPSNWGAGQGGARGGGKAYLEACQLPQEGRGEMVWSQAARKSQSMLSFIPRAFSHPYLHSLCLYSQEWGRVASGSMDT